MRTQKRKTGQLGNYGGVGQCSAQWGNTNRSQQVFAPVDDKLHKTGVVAPGKVEAFDLEGGIGVR